MFVTRFRLRLYFNITLAAVISAPIWFCLCVYLRASPWDYFSLAMPESLFNCLRLCESVQSASFCFALDSYAARTAILLFDIGFPQFISIRIVLRIASICVHVPQSIICFVLCQSVWVRFNLPWYASVYLTLLVSIAQSHQSDSVCPSASPIFDFYQYGASLETFSVSQLAWFCFGVSCLCLSSPLSCCTN